jgi:hypothetical protein
MADHTGSLVGNTCFFNSLQAGLRQIGHPLANIHYNDFLTLGGWSHCFRGRMVDTYTHAAHIERLARALGVKIHVYSEIIPGVTNSTIYSPFGSQGAVIQICRCYNFQHFKHMSFGEVQNMQAEERRRAEEAEARRLDALHAQAASDTVIVKALVEKEAAEARRRAEKAEARRRAEEAEAVRRAEEAEARRLDALHAQAAADGALALEIQEKDEAQRKQEREDMELAQLLTQWFAV